ncbi:MAG TPA: helix-turn-helix transcriptional regulator [Thermoanaerobaculia bacterium]|nr:helix-turn-helix transcriptional regulator [Thermoanaerobaculia bacterium]
MKQGDVLRKEREKKGLTVEETATRLGIPAAEYQDIEAGTTPAEDWGHRLAQIAISLETPTSRLLAESGRFADCKAGQAAQLIRQHRERRGKAPQEIAEAMGISVEEYQTVETGTSPIEKYGPLFLGFAEAIEQPVFNLFYPCGLPFQELDDYP